eukprot:3040290-Rhodomonas_salina.2
MTWTWKKEPPAVKNKNRRKEKRKHMMKKTQMMMIMKKKKKKKKKKENARVGGLGDLSAAAPRGADSEDDGAGDGLPSLRRQRALDLPRATSVSVALEARHICHGNCATQLECGTRHM